MADEIKEFSRDEVFGTIFPGAPSPVTPAQQSAAAFTPVPGPVAPPNLAMPSKSRAPVGMPDPTKLVETVSKANKALQEETAPPAPPSAIGGLVDQVISNWKPIAATAAATYAVTKAAPIISRGIGAAYNKATQKSPQQVFEQTRIDPIFATEQEMTQAREALQKPGPTLTPMENLQQRANDLRAAVQAGTPEPVGTPLSAAPVGAPAPTSTAGPGSFATTAVVDEIKDMIQETPAQPAQPAPQVAPQPVAPPQELRTGTGKPAFAGMGPAAALNKKGEPKFKPEYPSMEAVPSGYAFIPGAQYIDTPRQNIGQPEYTKAYTNQPFPLTNELAIQESKDINKLLGRATRAEMIAAGLPPAEITPGITKKTSAGTKSVRVAGILGALTAIPDLAKAETAGQRGLAGANLLEAILPPGFMMGGAGEGSSTVPSVDAAMLLGSPYAQTEIAKKRRQQEEYTRKVGAGRGIAPPSAYMR